MGIEQGVFPKPDNNETPDWMVEEANNLVKKIGGTFEQAIDHIKESEQVWENLTLASPDAPAYAIMQGVISNIIRQKR